MLWSYLAVMSPVLLMMSLRELELPLTTVGKGMAVVSRLTSIPRHWPLTTNSVSYCPANSMVTSSENWGIRVLLANATSTLQVPPGSRVIVLVGEMVRAPVDWRAGVSGVKAKLKVTGAGLLLMIGIYFFFLGEFLATSVAPRSTILCLGSATSTYRQKNMSTCKYRLNKVRSGSREESPRRLIVLALPLTLSQCQWFAHSVWTNHWFQTARFPHISWPLLDRKWRPCHRTFLGEYRFHSQTCAAGSRYWDTSTQHWKKNRCSPVTFC